MLKKFEKQKGSKAKHFVYCLENMAVAGEGSDLLSPLKKMKKINRGGLFLLNDDTIYLNRKKRRYV